MEEVITIVIFLLLSFLLCINWDIVSSPGLLGEVLVAWKNTRDGLLNRNDSAKCIEPSSSALKATGCPCSHDTAFPKFERYPSREVWTVHVLQLLADCTYRKGVCTPQLNLENSLCILWCPHCGLNCNLYRKKFVARDICHVSCACYFQGAQMMSVTWESCAQKKLCTCSSWCLADQPVWHLKLVLTETSRFPWTDAQQFVHLSVGLWCFTETQDVFHTPFPQLLTEVRFRGRLSGTGADSPAMSAVWREVNHWHKTTWAAVLTAFSSVSRGGTKEQWCEASTNGRCWV